MAKGGVRVSAQTLKKRHRVRQSMKKTRRVRPTTFPTYKNLVAPTVVEVSMNVEAPVSLRRSTRKAAAAASKRIHEVLDPEEVKKAERAAREEAAKEEAERKARLAKKRAAEAMKRAAEAEEAEFTKPVGRRGETMKNITEMLSMMTVPSKGSPNSGSPVPVYRIRGTKRLSPINENY